MSRDNKPPPRANRHGSSSAQILWLRNHRAERRDDIESAKGAEESDAAFAQLVALLDEASARKANASARDGSL